MNKFRVQLFPKKNEKPKGLIDVLRNIFVGKLKLKQNEFLDLKIGRYTKHGYNCVDVYYKNELIGEIRKNGIDELIEKGALASAKFFGYMHDVPKITITCLEPDEYRDKQEYKIWIDKIKKRRHP